MECTGIFTLHAKGTTELTHMLTQSSFNQLIQILVTAWLGMAKSSIGFPNYRQTFEQSALFIVNHAAMDRLVLVLRLTTVALPGIRLHELPNCKAGMYGPCVWACVSQSHLLGGPLHVHLAAFSSMPGW